MTTAKEVNGLRKSGNLDLAYKLSLDLIGSPQADDWDRAAYFWCLISLAKRSAEQVNQSELAAHLAELRRFDVPKENVLLAEHWQKTLELSQPGTQDLRRARVLSRQGQHADAIEIYERLSKQQDLAVSDKQSWGWEILRLILAELRTVDGEKPPHPAIQRARQHLNGYMKLGLKGPNKLHTAMLQNSAPRQRWRS